MNPVVKKVLQTIVEDRMRSMVNFSLGRPIKKDINLRLIIKQGQNFISRTKRNLRSYYALPNEIQRSRRWTMSWKVQMGQVPCILEGSTMWKASRLQIDGERTRESFVLVRRLVEDILCPIVNSIDLRLKFSRRWFFISWQSFDIFLWFKSYDWKWSLAELTGRVVCTD